MNESAKADLVKFEERSVAEIPPQDSFLATIERLASNPAVDVQKIQQILDMQEQILNRNAEQAFNADMVLAQAEMPTIPKDLKNNQTHSNYSAYETILKYAKPVYTKHGFSISFYEEDTEGDEIRVCADVMHREGHTKKRFTDVPIDNKGIKGTVNKTGPHAKKSSVSYGRGILICGVFNIPTGNDVDDDGNGAGSPSITEKQLSQIVDMIASTETDEIKFLKFMKVKSLETIPAKAFVKAMNALKAKARKNADNN